MNPQSLRLAFLSPFLYRFPRGIERFTINLANQLAALGQQVTLLTRKGSVAPATPIAPAVQVKRIPYLRYFEAQGDVPFWAAHLARGRFDIVNVFFASYGEAEALNLLLRLHPTLVNFIVGYPFELVPHHFHAFRNSGLDRRLNRVIVKSRYMLPPLQEFFRCPVAVIPNGIDTDDFDPQRADDSALRQELGIQLQDQVLLTVAALEKRKGMFAVVEALALLKTRVPALRYLVVGEGADRTELERRIAALGLEERVTLCGNRSDVRPFYKLADLFLLPSYGEGFPNAWLEALSMECPVIVSHHPPYDELMRADIGVQVNEQDASELANAVETLLQQPERRLRMGRAARRYAQAHYAWSQVAKQYLDLFRAQSQERRK